MIKLYGYFPSRSNRPHWALEEIGAEYEFYQLDFAKGDNRSSFYLNINPSGKLPALQDGDLLLTESGAICNYLGEKFPESKLTPASGTAERPLYDQWLFFILTELEQPLWTKGKHTFALPQDIRCPSVLESTQWEFAKAVALLSKGLGEREFLAADHFTIVDIMCAQTLRWAIKFEYPIEQHSNLVTYLERMEQRPAVAKMREKVALQIPR